MHCGKKFLSHFFSRMSHKNGVSNQDSPRPLEKQTEEALDPVKNIPRELPAESSPVPAHRVGAPDPLGMACAVTTGKPTHLQTGGLRGNRKFQMLAATGRPGLRVDRNPDWSGTISHLTLLVGTLRNKQGFWIVFFHSNQ